MSAPEPKDSERRVAPRRRLLKAGKIFINGGESVYDCTVRDLSASGARISLALFQPLPKRFKLEINGFGTYICERVRIRGTKAGTEFGVRFVVAGGAATEE